MEGEVADMSAGAFLSNTTVRVGSPQEAGQCDIIIISAGAKQREGFSRCSSQTIKLWFQEKQEFNLSTGI